MAPELARTALDELSRGSLVLDPMCGSGTVLREAVERGFDCVGYDIDPLAVLMSQAWTSQVDAYRLLHDAHLIAERATDLRSDEVETPWKTDETQAFADYWFAPQQMEDLARLAQCLKTTRLRSRPLLRICFSRLIITKDRGASLARDVSHSRPHRVATTSDFDVFKGFLRAARHVASRLEPDLISGKATVHLGDVRQMRDRRLYDLILTSPPYLNAIDYLRGHRMSLIWMGHEIGDLRKVRSTSIGAERGVPGEPLDVEEFIRRSPSCTITSRQLGWIQRFSGDMESLFSRLTLAVRPGGKIVLVVGNSFVRGATVDNVGIVVKKAEDSGLRLVGRSERQIPARRRYLPTPASGSPLALRMRSEAIVKFLAA